jgi:hypothetical protein
MQYGRKRKGLLSFIRSDLVSTLSERLVCLFTGQVNVMRIIIIAKFDVVDGVVV